MQLAIKKWGNSVGVRIPSIILNELQLQAESLIDIRVENGKIIIEPVRAEYDLSKMISEITPENLHQEVSTGSPIGKELL